MKLFGIPYQLRQLEYIIGDALLGLMAIFLGGVALGGTQAPELMTTLRTYPGASVFFICASMVTLYIVDAYSADHDFRRRFEIGRLWGGLFLSLPLQLATFALLPDSWLGAGSLMANLLAYGVLLTVWQFLLCSIGPQPYFRQKMLIVGAGQAGHLMVRMIRENPEYASRYPIVGFVDQVREGNRRRSDFPEDERVDVEGAPPVLGTVADLVALATRNQVGLIVVALRGAMSIELMKALLECKSRGVVIDDMPSLYKQLTGKVPILHMSESWLIFGPMFAGASRFGMAVERIADIAVALVGLIVSAPFILVSAIAIKLESPGPVFYLQERLGKNERPFMIIKLRTMRNDAEAKTGAV